MGNNEKGDSRKRNQSNRLCNQLIGYNFALPRHQQQQLQQQQQHQIPPAQLQHAHQLYDPSHSQYESQAQHLQTLSHVPQLPQSLGHQTMLPQYGNTQDHESIYSRINDTSSIPQFFTQTRNFSPYVGNMIPSNPLDVNASIVTPTNVPLNQPLKVTSLETPVEIAGTPARLSPSISSSLPSKTRLIRTTALQHALNDQDGITFLLDKSKGKYLTENSHKKLDPSQYPKLSLKIMGNLNTMTLNWTQSELACKRRLVKFTKKLKKSTLTVTFEPVLQSLYTPNDAIVSCIMRQRTYVRPEFYITSVDVISLLEKLIGYRFEVEEKNRIRRNLQALKPLTVNKTDKSSSEFFNQIMQYESPKPRNIEKNVKVFAWSTVADALHKVCSKYSCDFGGTEAFPAVPSGSIDTLASSSSFDNYSGYLYQDTGYQF